MAYAFITYQLLAQCLYFLGFDEHFYHIVKDFLFFNILNIFKRIQKINLTFFYICGLNESSLFLAQVFVLSVSVLK